MSRIAVLLTHDFEDSEYSKPAEAFLKEGHQLIHIGLKKGEEVTGKKKLSTVRIDQAVVDVAPGDFDALFIPGGYSPDQLRAHIEPVRFVKDFMRTHKPILAICHGPQLLISADVLDGRTITGWKSIAVDLRNAGARYLDQEVVEDGNIISSRCPQDIPAFVEKSLQKLKMAHV
jgi:protease I